MLTLENVLKLAELGFTKDEIMQFSNSEQQVEVVEGEPAEFTPPAETAEPAPAAEPVPAAPAPDNTELISAIQDLKKTIQASNISSTPQPVQESLQDKAEDVLMKLVNM
jgi:hypothetical protein